MIRNNLVGWLILLSTQTALAQDAPVKPRGSVTINRGERLTRERTVTLTIRATKDVKEMATSVDGSTWTPWKPATATAKIELPAGDGAKTVSIKFMSEDGIESDLATATITLDATPPVGKVTTPPVSATSQIILVSDVPDAVAMQFFEQQWSPWEPYARPKELTVSAGDGPKTVQARYRDEAGNISEPVQVQVEIKTGETPSAPTRVRSVFLGACTEQSKAFEVTVEIRGTDLAAMSFDVDGTSVTAKEPFAESKVLVIAKNGGSHRVRVNLWGPNEEAESGEIAFQEADLSRKLRPKPSVHEKGMGLFQRVNIGVWSNGLEFDAITVVGPRSMDSGTMGLLQYQVGLTFWDPLFAAASIDYATGDDATIVSVGVDVGARLYHGSIGSVLWDAEIFVGGVAAQLEVDVDDFGDFDHGFGLRTGLTLRAHVSDLISVDASTEFRQISFDYDPRGDVVSGDTDATAGGVLAMIGVNLRF